MFVVAILPYQKSSKVLFLGGECRRLLRYLYKRMIFSDDQFLLGQNLFKGTVKYKFYLNKYFINMIYLTLIEHNIYIDILHKISIMLRF